ncbi:endoglin isoform X2 [Eublepharis macularius]|uniref:Endoglin isoform X2 n=1 Tax=Eublepharis macularius TaxID=481883 RepID=A0AA97KBW6_EUBMA|nr:endoglin isoform X2 [Eublepharis macularius]
MDSVWCLVLLLAFSVATNASPVTVQECPLQPLGQGQGVKVLYSTSRVPSGCVSQGAPEADQEVHILYLQYGFGSGVSQLHLNISAAEGNNTQPRKVVFVVGANSFSFLTVHAEDLPLTFIYNSENIFLNVDDKETNRTKLPSFASGEELLMWAKLNYGGVSSFTSVESPQRIHFQVGKEIGTSVDCVPETDFDAGQYFEMEVISSEIKSCPHPSKHPGKEAHILWLHQGNQDSGTQAVELNMNVTCDKGDPFKELNVALVLKSRQSLLWNIGSVPHSVQFLASGKYSLKQMKTGEINGITLPDSKEDLIREVHNRGFDFIASYTEIPSANRITIEVVRCEQPAVTISLPPSSPAHDTTEETVGLLNIVKPWKCLENTVEVALAKQYLRPLNDPITAVTLRDPLCMAQDNTTHFVLRSFLGDCSTVVEKGIHVQNELILTLASQQQVTVPFQCDLPEKLSVQLYPTSEFDLPSTTVEVNKVAYVQVSFRTADEKSSLQLQECSLKTTGKMSLPLIHNGVSAGSSVEVLNSPYNPTGTKIHRFRFMYEAEDGGWSSLSATLVCRVFLNHHDPSSFESSLEVKLKNPNFPLHNQGLGLGTVGGITFGAFLIGVLLTAALWYIYSHTRPLAKMQPVSANPPASESSSTNHSIGSTQSTPCSTSSVA